jgi:tetratricopeptide (TPR) repeat protein
MRAPEDGPAYRDAAAEALHDKNWKAAQAALEKYLALLPNDPIAWNNLGVTLEKQHKSREAVEAFARASSLSAGGRLPGRNLVSEMQRYLGFAAVPVLFKLIELVVRLLPLPDDIRTALNIVALVGLIVGALAFYVRRRDDLPPEAWHAYKSELTRTRPLRYGGLAFVFGGFLIFAVVLFLLFLGPGPADDGTVVLVMLAGFCWLISAQLIWRRVVRPVLERRL